jgi:hypothetical protein
MIIQNHNGAAVFASDTECVSVTNNGCNGHVNFVSEFFRHVSLSLLPDSILRLGKHIEDAKDDSERKAKVHLTISNS